MQSGISLKVVSDFDSELWGLPPPSAIRWLSKMDGTKTLEVLYHFQYAPQSWREWQRVASIKIQIKQRVPHAQFDEYIPPDEVQRVYTVAELGRHFSKFIKYHKPLYPCDKSKFMSSLTLYAMRLHYEEQLHYEALLAMALHFNSKGGYGYSFRELNKKVKATLLLDRSSWRVKLNSEELQQAHSKGGLLTVTKKRERFKAKRDEAVELRKSGMLLKDIASKLEVSIITVKRWKLPKC